MSKKSSNLLEEHIEKIVLGIVGLVCIWLLITRVLFSPNYVEYDNKKFGSGEIDVYISEQAGHLEDELGRKSEPLAPYKPRFGDFVALVDSAISNVDVSLNLPQPIISSRGISDNRVYTIPLIGEVNDVRVEHIRAVAYVPTEEIDEENNYSEARCEPNDLDFVTVEAKFDVARLYKNFYENFAGSGVQEEWRDPCLAVPIFAAVQLQRQELLADGSWSDWQIVPRTRIDAGRKMFEVIEDVGQLPSGGIKVRLLQFNDGQVRMDMLQPESYKIASAEEEWFPPTLHKKFIKLYEGEKAQERREAKAAEKEEREREREEARTGRSSRTSETRTRSGDEYGGITDSDYYGGGTSSRRSSTTRSRGRERQSEKERPEKSKGTSKTASTSDVYNELDEILIDDGTNFARMHEPLTFWAHDDTVKPQRSYRYRIRLGVFNPIAGTNQFDEQDKSQKNKVVLWSKFSDMTEPVEIPGRLYFFTLDIQEAVKRVTVQVSRYVLGYWYSKKLTVEQGEVIGKVMAYEPVEDKEEGVTVPETVDYSTGAILVDVIPVNDWSGGNNMRYYFDMLYSFDGASIEHMPIKSRYWAKGLQGKFNEVRKSEKEPKEPLRIWGGKTGGRQRQQRGLERGYEGEGGYEAYYDEYMTY